METESPEKAAAFQETTPGLLPEEAAGHAEGKPGESSPVSDLRSSSPICDLQPAGHAPAAPDAPVWRKPNAPQAQSLGLVDGAALRRHGGHAWCSTPARDGLCVHQSQHQEFIGRLGRSGAADELLAWYPTVLAAFAGRAIGESAFEFWRNCFTGWVGTASSVPTAAQQRALGPVHVAWECPHEPTCQSKTWCAAQIARDAGEAVAR